jgi:hypothetical protein
MCVHYLTTAGWEQEWIDNAIELTENCWRKHYKPAHLNNTAQATESSSNASPFAFTICIFSIIIRLLI